MLSHLYNYFHHSNFQVKNSFFYHTHTFICILFYIFPPKANHCPSHKQQFLINLIIPLTVSRNFRYPVFTVIPFFKPWFQNFPVFSVKKFSIAKNSNFYTLSEQYLASLVDPYSSFYTCTLYPTNAFRSIVSIFVLSDRICCIFFFL